MNFKIERQRSGWKGTAAIGLLAIAITAPAQAEDRVRSHAGVLVCAADQDWGSTIASNRSFECTFSSTNGEVRGKYRAEIRDFGSDVRRTGSSVLIWQVAGPPERIGDNYQPGGLSGIYGRPDGEASSNLQLGPNTLVGIGPRSYSLQPVSVQFETGLSVAVGVDTLVLEFIGPITI